MTHYGVWDSENEIFVDGPFLTRIKAVHELNCWMNFYPADPLALEVAEYCPSHMGMDQPKIGCVGCAEDADA